MIRGIETFREWFRGYEEQYVIIGGTACDLLMENAGLDFRATKDVDLVLIVEAIDTRFGERFWEYIVNAGYEHKNKSLGTPQFYRFKNPKSKNYPAMIELFTRKLDFIILPDNAVLTPIPIGEDISSLSAILLNDDYYQFLKQGRIRIDGVTVLNAPYIIPFKVKAWLDLSERKAKGEQVDGKNIRKHKNDIFRLTELLGGNENLPIYVPSTVLEDVKLFLERISEEDIDLKQLGIRNRTKEDILRQISTLYA